MSQWIPVKERMPSDELGDFVVTDGNQFAIGMLLDGEIYTQGSLGGLVVAWMPLPEYEGEQS